MKPLACFIATVMLGAAWVTAAAPKVVQTVPEAGAVDVPLTVTEIRVTFDQDMSQGGFSFAGGGDDFPEVTGRPHWIDARTCVLPVKLKSGWEYHLSFNSTRARNFKNLAGESAEPYPLTFKTKPDAASTQRATEQLAHNKSAIDNFIKAINNNYSYRDRLGLDWDKLIAEVRPTLEAAETPQAFARELVKVLVKAEDIHIRLGIGELEKASLSQVYRKNAQLNFDLKRMQAAVPNVKAVGKQTWVGSFEDGTAYILIGAWSDANEVTAAIQGLGSATRLVLDVRANGGGDELLARRFAGLFIDKPVLYAKHQTRAEGKWSEISDRWLRPNAERPVFQGKVVLLQGPGNFSSNESFIQMMKAAGATTLGGITGGSSGNPKRFDLGNGVIVALPSWKALQPDGTELEGVGLKPDIEVLWTPTGTDDPVITKALELVRK